MVLSLLTATAFSYQSDAMTKAGLLHGVSWIAQFLGHGLAEKRAPALLDNLLGGTLRFLLICNQHHILTYNFSCGTRALLRSPRTSLRDGIQAGASQANQQRDWERDHQDQENRWREEESSREEERALKKQYLLGTYIRHRRTLVLSCSLHFCFDSYLCAAFGLDCMLTNFIHSDSLYSEFTSLYPSLVPFWPGISV